MDKIIHKIGLLVSRRDIEIKQVVDSVYEFMVSKIEKKDLENDEKTNFFHQHLGKFYFNKKIYKRINKLNKKND